MVYKNVNASAIACLLASFGVFAFAAQAYAARPTQTSQALWRVESSQERAITPSYNQQKTPFAVKEMPVVAVKKVVKPVIAEPEISPEEMLRRERSKKAAVLLGEVRDILSDEKAFEADVSQLKLGGRMKGPKGFRVYVNGEWLGVGAVLKVPVIANANIGQLISDLAAVDEKIAEVVKLQSDEKMNALKEYQLTIEEIHSDKVVFQDETQRRHELTY